VALYTFCVIASETKQSCFGSRDRHGGIRHLAMTHIIVIAVSQSRERSAAGSEVPIPRMRDNPLNRHKTRPRDNIFLSLRTRCMRVKQSFSLFFTI